MIGPYFLIRSMNSKTSGAAGVFRCMPFLTNGNSCLSGKGRKSRIWHEMIFRIPVSLPQIDHPWDQNIEADQVLGAGIIVLMFQFPVSVQWIVQHRHSARSKSAVNSYYHLNEIRQVARPPCRRA